MSSVYPTLHESLRQLLAQRSGWTELRDVQEEACRVIRTGSDALVIAPTAGGKSEAALIPVTDGILRGGHPGIACLYIAPLKALINDQEERFRAFCTPLSLSVVKWHGDVARGERSWEDGEPPHFLMITPESLEVLLQDRAFEEDLRQVRSIIVDELHAFVESERGVQLKMLLYRLDLLAGRKIQRIGLSATAGNPREILAWLSDGRQAAELVSVPAPPQEKQFLFVVEPDRGRRTDALVRIVAGRKALVFVNSRSAAEEIVAACAGRIRNLHIHHSSVSAAARRQAEEAFGSEEGACIVCTSTLELGIDIGDLDVVVQAGPPDSVASFLQRMGRSGRRGKAAFVAWILESPAELLCSAAIIECAMEKKVEDLRPVERPWNVLVQQIFLWLLSHPRTTRRELAGFLIKSPVFHDTDPRVLDRLLDVLLEKEFLAADGSVLMPGPEAERVFGRSNWKEIFSVIAGGGEIRAVTPDGEVVGMLDARFVNRAGTGGITLGGRGWSVIKSDGEHNLVVVVPGEAGGSRTFWTGGDADGLSSLVCRQVGEIRARGSSALPLGAREQDLLQQALARFPEGIGPEGLYVREPAGESRGSAIVYSLNGSRFNRVLALLLRHRLGPKARVRYDDFVVLVDRPVKSARGRPVAEAIREIQGTDLPDLAAALPPLPAEGWKFARALPGPLFRDMVVSGHYHGGEFLSVCRELAVRSLPGSEKAEPGPD